MKSCTLPLVLLCMWQLQEGAQACSCLRMHPQTLICQADVIIKAKVVAEKYLGEFNNTIKYDIDQTMTFKGPERIFHNVYTRSSSATCGRTLTIGTEYFIAGLLNSEGLLRISLCDYVGPWEAISAGQLSLVQRYMRNCGCDISYCGVFPCDVSNPTGCLWADWLPFDLICTKKRDGTCAWYKAPVLAK
ncbi:metalloproteinase inhibitor 2-like isoform X1 [Nerophis lumbriciformis]|uniref:metalloproteinase inhibitor 2-like isoform X1 n=1 Tax=Nerophis lumbriciformis TaxID=546530 RepID=UPI002AE05683|nr:metalloproteinase inhibitor 2-like isoform X1 [Nerophis lumbriciformis]